jgi:hypothetical protein
MLVGNVPADWRSKRLLIKAQLTGKFFDVETDESRVFLEKQTDLARDLASYGVTTLDVAVIRGPDRRVTRRISQWVHDQCNGDGVPVYAGIRYLSRLDTNWECWAAFERTSITELERHTIAMRNVDLRAVTKRWNIVVH